MMKVKDMQITTDKIDEVVNPPKDAPFNSVPPKELDKIGMQSYVLINTGLRNFAVVSVKVGNRRVFAVTGEAGPAASVKLATKDGVVGEHHVRSAIVCFDSDGNVLFREDFSHEKDNCSICVYPAFIDISGNGDWAVSYIAGGRGMHDIYLRLIDGELIWKTPVPGKNKWGNGSCISGDINNDGKVEIVYGCNTAVVCIDAASGKILWVYDNAVAICHGRLSYGDVNGDGKGEICFGTEYSDNHDKCLSSIVVLDCNGNEVARKRNILGDLGSTQTVLADINNDGKLEILNASQNLCWNEPRHPSNIFAFDGNLDETYPAIANGCPRFSVADVDGDGHLEAVGITDYRDGGTLRQFAVVCTDLLTGKIKWALPVSRCWLTGDSVCADFDGDGKQEVLLTSNYGTGYSFQPEEKPWSDVYVVKADGTLLFCKTFPNMIYSPIVADVDGDGLAEIVAPCYDGNIYVIKTPAKACDADWPFVCQNVQRTGVYPNNG